MKKNQEKLGTGKGILILLIPIVGIFIWLNNRDTNPKKAQDALILTAVGFTADIIFAVSRKMKQQNTLKGTETEIKSITE